MKAPDFALTKKLEARGFVLCLEKTVCGNWFFSTKCALPHDPPPRRRDYRPCRMKFNFDPETGRADRPETGCRAAPRDIFAALRLTADEWYGPPAPSASVPSPEKGGEA